MIVFLNGQFVPETKAVVSVFDRGFLFGDALWEAMLVTRGRPFLWAEHIRRFQQGIDVLKLALPWTFDELEARALELIQRNQMPEAMLRLTVSRGITGRGYSPRNAKNPAIVMSLHPAPRLDPTRPARWRVVTSSLRLPVNDPLARFKTANKLPQILARAEADTAGAHEALLLNTRGCVAEGTTSNIFWVNKNIVHTPPLAAGPLPGVTRSLVGRLCRDAKIPFRETQSRPGSLFRAEGVFLTMTSYGIVEVESLDGKKLSRSPLTRQLYAAYLRAALVLPLPASTSAEASGEPPFPGGGNGPV